MTRFRHQTRPVTDTLGRRAGWGVFPAGSSSIAVSFSGRRAWWRAHRLAAALDRANSPNRRGR